MQFKIVSTKKANSHILAHTIRLKDLVIRKGKVLEKEHIALLIRNNINQIYVAIIEKNDLSENLSVKFGEILGRVIAPIVMAFVYFVIVTPIGLLMRMIGKDLLNTKFSKEKSYWIKREKNIGPMKRQF